MNTAFDDRLNKDLKYNIQINDPYSVTTAFFVKGFEHYDWGKIQNSENLEA